MINLSLLFFRVKKAEWNSHQYIFEVPSTAYANIVDASKGITDDDVVVSWHDMTARVYSDIHQDS